jgi:adiponectin receptor
MIGIMGVLCFGAFATTLFDQFEQPKYRPIRAGLFIGAGLSSFGTFMAVLIHPTESKMQVNMIWYSVAGYVLIQGAVIYAIRVPERCSPGKFDLCGASH